MNLAKHLRTTLLAGMSLFILASCQKQSVVQPAQTMSLEDETAELMKTTDVTGECKLVLRPSIHGQDTYVTFLDGNPDWANSTGDWAEELSMAYWTNGGRLEGLRSFIKFEKLSVIPKKAQISSAMLYLHAKGTSIISAPQGNSGYSGSPYNVDNGCKIERVTGGDWEESTLTWNTQPAVTSIDAALIPPSNSQYAYDAVVDVTRMVQAMVSNPDTNYGFRLSLVTESIYRSMIFASSESTNPKLRPRLVIRFK